MSLHYPRPRSTRLYARCFLFKKNLIVILKKSMKTENKEDLGTDDATDWFELTHSPTVGPNKGEVMGSDLA